MKEALPLVTLGVPVRNGASMLRAALDSIVAQDYPNIEIVVSDNASDDATPEILAEYAAKHPNMRVIRQERALTAIDNFLFVLKEAKGVFFAWCAHDDTRSADFVSGLIRGFDDPATVLTFGDLFISDGVNKRHWRSEYDFSTVELNTLSRLRKVAGMQCYHIYGLWRTTALQAVRYRYTHWWSDMPIMLAAATLGSFRHVSGPAFCYFEVPKTDGDRAAYQDYQSAKSKLYSLSSLIWATYLSVANTSNFKLAVAASFFISAKYLTYFPVYLGSRSAKILALIKRQS